MISDNELKKILKQENDKYTDFDLEKMIELLKTLAYLDYEIQKRRKYAK